MTQRKSYTEEFKREAVRLLEESDQSPNEIALDLGVRRNQLYKWQQQLRERGEGAFKNKVGRPKKADQSEASRLRQENKRLREENEILKKAAAYFAKELD